MIENPASSRGIWCLKGAKRSPLTKWKSWKSRAKETKAVIGSPSECQKQRDFQSGLDFDEKGGGGRGGQKCRISRKYAVQSGQKRSFGAHFGRNRASLGAFERILINPCSKAVQNDHIQVQPDFPGLPILPDGSRRSRG